MQVRVFETERWEGHPGSRFANEDEQKKSFTRCKTHIVALVAALIGCETVLLTRARMCRIIISKVETDKFRDFARENDFDERGIRTPKLLQKIADLYYTRLRPPEWNRTIDRSVAHQLLKPLEVCRELMLRPLDARTLVSLAAAAARS